MNSSQTIAGIRVALFVALLITSGCSTPPEPPGPLGSDVGRVAALAAPPVANTTTLPGYVHNLSASRFAIGQTTAIEVATPQLTRWRGSLGAFAADPTNGWSMATLNADSPQGPYNLDPVDHGAKVKAYFVGAGLPAEQVSDVATTYGGVIGPSAATTSTSLVQNIKSVLRRSVSNIDIVDSYAVARMTVAGDVDMETVFWPSIDMSVVNEAIAFAKKMANTTARVAYLASLPGYTGKVYHDRGVVIRHSSLVVHSTPTAFVSYDATLRAGSDQGDHHFDENGVEFLLPQEQVTFPQSVR